MCAPSKMTASGPSPTARVWSAGPVDVSWSQGTRGAAASSAIAGTHKSRLPVTIMIPSPVSVGLRGWQRRLHLELDHHVVVLVRAVVAVHDEATVEIPELMAHNDTL